MLVNVSANRTLSHLTKVSHSDNINTNVTVSHNGNFNTSVTKPHSGNAITHVSFVLVQYSLVYLDGQKVLTSLNSVHLAMTSGPALAITAIFFGLPPDSQTDNT